MDRTERFYKIDQLLSNHRSVSKEKFLEELDISEATFKRDLEYLRDRLNAPIEWDRSLRGYRFEVKSEDMPRYALPGLWFNASEAHALLSMQHLLSNLQPSLLQNSIEPLKVRIRALLEQNDHSISEIEKRIKIYHSAPRTVDTNYFEVISNALLSRKQLQITHHNRWRDDETDRLISPQRLIYYRDNWYLDSWCHLREGLRRFSLASIRRVQSVEQKAKDVSEKVLNRHFETGYGVFSGVKTKQARLRFTPEQIHWIIDQEWHPKQEGYFDNEGYYILEFPYTHDRELIMDILKYGARVEVVGPEELRHSVKEELINAVDIY